MSVNRKNPLEAEMDQFFAQQKKDLPDLDARMREEFAALEADFPESSDGPETHPQDRLRAPNKRTQSRFAKRLPRS